MRFVAVIALIATPCACGSSNDAAVVPPVPAVPLPAPDVRDAMPDSLSLTATTVNPPLGPAGQWVYVAGSGFEAGATVLLPGAAPVPAHVYRPDLLGFTVPPGARGSSPVTVECRGHQVSSTESFTIGIPHERPAITRFLPTSGRRGTFVVVDGDNFVHGQTTVLLDHASIEGHVYGPTSLWFHVSDDVRHTGPIAIQTPNGIAHSDGNFGFEPEPGMSPDAHPAGASRERDARSAATTH